MPLPVTQNGRVAAGASAELEGTDQATGHKPRAGRRVRQLTPLFPTGLDSVLQGEPSEVDSRV